MLKSFFCKDHKTGNQKSWVLLLLWSLSPFGLLFLHLYTAEVDQVVLKVPSDSEILLLYDQLAPGDNFSQAGQTGESPPSQESVL